MKLKYFLLVLTALIYSSYTNAQSVSITSSATNNTILSGTSVTFTATPLNYTTPNYQWYKNGTAISGATSTTYSSTSLSNNDQIKVTVVEGSPSVETSGLVLNLDSGNSSSYTGSTTTWTDLTGRGNDGTFNNVAYAASNQGELSFDGTTSYVSLPNSTDFNFGTGDFAIELWAKNNSTSKTPNLLAINSNNNFFSSVRIGWAPSINGNPTVTFAHSTNGTTWSIQTGFTGSFSNWTQIVLSRSSGVVTLYANGANKGTYNLTGSLMSTTTSNPIYNQIGTLPAWQSVYTLLGTMSIARIYKASGLTSSQVINNYNTICSRYGLSPIGSTSNTVTTTVNTNNSITLTSATDTNNQSIANNVALTNITYSTTGATGATFSGLPTGVTGTWSNNNVTIAGTPTIAGSYNYTITLTGGYGSITTTGTITVREITITSNSGGSGICAGTSVTFTATASGFTTPNYQWYKNNVAISGATTSTYSTTSLNNNDVIKVSCSEAPGIVNDNSLSLWLDASNTASYSTGTTWRDLSGNNNDATLNNGASFDATSKSIVTNGVDQYISVPLFNSSITNTTMQAWVYVNANSHGGFISNGNSSYSIGIGSNVSGEMNNNGNQAWMLFSSVRYINTNSTYPTGWHLVTMTMDANATPSYYLDGSFVYTSSGSSPNTPSDSFNLGAVPGDGPKYYNGKFASAFFYNRALTASEILQNYNATVGSIGGLSSASIFSNSITTTVNPAPSATLTIAGDGCINKTTLLAPSGLSSYTWYKDAIAISGAITNDYTPTTTGSYSLQVSIGTCSATSSTTTISVCGLTKDGSMSPLETSTTLVSKDGAINNGKGIDEKGKILSKPWAYGTITTRTGRIWIDRNLGASRVALSPTDTQAYGDYYQWGRPADGHEKHIVSGTVNDYTTVKSTTSIPPNSKYIFPSDGSMDWLETPDNTLWTGVNAPNNPCPEGFRIPTESEWAAEAAVFTSNNVAGSFEAGYGLKLTLGGMAGSPNNITALGNYGQYLSQTAFSDGRVRYFGVISWGTWFDNNYHKITGQSCRCIKD